MAFLQPEYGFSVVIDPEQWYRFKQDLDKFDPALARSLRRRIKAAGDTAAKKVQAELGMPSPAGGPDDGAGRRALIAATRVSVSFSKRSSGARIVTSGSGLPAGHEGLLKVYNKATFRHPVYPREGMARSDWTWVNQKGRPYFGSVILKAMNEAVAQEIFDAVDDAVRAIGARGNA
jgi:hypothetical protein